MLEKIAKAYACCEEVIRIHSATFYKAFSFLPEDQKKAVWAIYAFCRTIDDIIDEGNEPHKEILAFEEAFQAFKEGKHQNSDDFMWLALTDVFNKFEMDIVPFEDMIKGQKMDLYKTRYETVDEMLEYSYYVASTVGLMLLPVLAPGKSDVLREGAIKLGLGMQITNILRDVGEDLLIGRIYVPKEMFAKHHYSNKEFMHYEVNERFVAMWEDLAVMAERYYEESLETVHEYPLYSQIPVKGAAHMYKAILDKVRKNNYNVFKHRNYVDNEEKSKIISSL